MFRTNRGRSNKRRHSLVSALMTLFIVIAALYGFSYYNSNGEIFHLPDIPAFSFSGNHGEIAENVPEDYNLHVTFLDVGQGNCTLIESDGHYMLIDGGDGSHSSFVVSYLSQYGIASLDYVIISHYDADHLSGVIGVLYNYPVGTLLSPDYETDTKIYNSYINCTTTQGIEPVHPVIGNTFALGNSSFTVVSPDNYQYDDENNRSIGIRINDDNHSFLVLGDAEKESETDMIADNVYVKSDVYMVSHHGSSSSSSAKFLKAVNPDYAVISVGADNKYGHPTDITLARLASDNITIFRTDQEGTIHAYSTPDGIVWQFE